MGHVGLGTYTAKRTNILKFAGHFVRVNRDKNLPCFYQIRSTVTLLQVPSKRPKRQSQSYQESDKILAEMQKTVTFRGSP